MSHLAVSSYTLPEAPSDAEMYDKIAEAMILQERLHQPTRGILMTASPLLVPTNLVERAGGGRAGEREASMDAMQ